MSVKRGTLGGAAVGVLLVTAWAPAWGGEGLEAGALDAKAAVARVSLEERTDSFRLRQYHLGALAQLSYLVASEGVAAVIDPQRDVERYVDDAREAGVKIRFVILTHTPVDFVAGHMELARREGAEILVGAQSALEVPHTALRDGDTLKLGSVGLMFWSTPGPTPDSMTLLVHLPQATVEPAFAITGDTLLLGTVGRPDPMGDDAAPAALASRAYDSIQRLKGLPDETRVLPAHGAGAFWGQLLVPETVSTIGLQKEANPFLRDRSRASFAAELLHALPSAPGYFAHAVRLNRKGPPQIAEARELPPEVAPEGLVSIAGQGAWVIDLREPSRYAEAHVPGAVNVSIRGRLETWTGTLVPPGQPLVLIGSVEDIREARVRLQRVGIDEIAGYLKGGMEAWTASGREVRSTRGYTPEDLYEAIRERREPLIVDVRTPQEYADSRIGDSVSIPIAEAERLQEVLDRSQAVVTVCSSDYRSSMAVGLLERQGFERVGHLVGGIDAWLQQSLPTERSWATPGVAGPASVPGSSASPQLYLPEPIEPRVLAAALSSQPELYAVLDTRPQWQFDEYHVPGAVSVGIEELGARVAALPSRARVVLVDRDGAEAQAIAAALLTWLGPQGRSVRVLEGGTARYYLDVELGASSTGDAAKPAGSSTPSPRTLPPGAPSPRPSSRKIRHAGC